MATVQLYLTADGASPDLEFDDITAETVDRCSLVWIDLDRSEREALDRCARIFSLHALAVESAVLSGERAQVTIYDDLLFLEFYGVRIVENGTRVELNEIGIFMGTSFVITVRGGQLPAVNHVSDRWQDAHKVHKPSASLLLHTLLDTIVDGYFPVIDELGEQVEGLEDRLMDERSRQPLREIHALRKDLFNFRRVIGPEREVLGTLIRRDVPVIDEDVIVYFADVHDHLLRALDWLDAFRDMLTTLFEVQLGLQSQRLDQIVRKLTASSIILMVASLIAGIYGMNFEHMPELGWMLGYPMALTLMAIATGSLLLFFRRRDWF